MNEYINTVEQAKSIAFDWAAENKKDLNSSIRYAEQWFKDTEEKYRGKKVLLLNIDIFQREREKSQKYWNETAEKDWQRNSEWSLETVKHLAFINGAALAGCAALFASSAPSSFHIKYSLTLFLLGLLLAVSDFYLCSRGYEIRAKKYQNISYEIQKSSFEKEINEILKNTDFKKEKEFILASCCGWTSIIFAFVGIVLLAIQLNAKV